MKTGAEEVRCQAKDSKNCQQPLGEPQRTSPEILDPGSYLLQCGGCGPFRQQALSTGCSPKLRGSPSCGDDGFHTQSKSQ